MNHINTQAIKAVIFDLDGVLVDTAKFHYQAWKQVAASKGMSFTEEDNEQLKGVSRVRSLDIILELNNTQLTQPEKDQMLLNKNEHYLDLISSLDSTDVLPGVTELIAQIKARKLKIALGSASKNAKPILASTGLLEHFEYLVDGNMVSKAKPDPEVFLTASTLLATSAEHCLVIEDAEAGVEAALRANMQVLAVGEPDVLGKATQVVKTLESFKL